MYENRRFIFEKGELVINSRKLKRGQICLWKVCSWDDAKNIKYIHTGKKQAKPNHITKNRRKYIAFGKIVKLVK